VKGSVGFIPALKREAFSSILRKPEEYDYLSKVDKIKNDPIPLDQAHPDFTPVSLTKSIKNILVWILGGIFWLLVIRAVVEILPF
jgi:hypothetical protein